MTHHILPVGILLLLVFHYSCEPSKPSHPSPDTTKDIYNQQKVIDDVTQKVWSFHAADTARDAQGVIDLLWPDFTMLADGNRTNYAEVVKGSPEFMKSLELFHTEWTDLQVIPISADAALSSFLFKDSIVAKSGTVTQAQGPNTFLWERRDGQWKVRFADADHYPVHQ